MIALVAATLLLLGQLGCDRTQPARLEPIMPRALSEFPPPPLDPSLRLELSTGRVPTFDGYAYRDVVDRDGWPRLTPAETKARLDQPAAEAARALAALDMAALARLVHPTKGLHHEVLCRATEPADIDITLPKFIGYSRLAWPGARPFGHEVAAAYPSLPYVSRLILGR
jgi:hypothetical protein